MSYWADLVRVSLASLVLATLFFYMLGRRLFDHSAGGRFLAAFLAASLHTVWPAIYLKTHGIDPPDLIAALEFLPVLTLFWRLAYTQASQNLTLHCPKGGENVKTKKASAPQ